LPSRIVIDALFTAVPKDNAAGAVTKSVADQIAFRSLVIDAGHGGYDYGIKGGNFAEKDFVLVFAKELSAILAKSGKDVVLTRKSDQVVLVSERAAMVNKKQPDMLLSLHVALTKTPAVYTVPEKPEAGAEPAAVTPSEHKRRETARLVAEAIAKNIEKEFSVSVSRESIPLSLLVRSKAPAVLIELPNPDDFSYEKKGRERLLSAILKGLAAVAKEEKQPAAVPKPDIKPDLKTESNNSSNIEKL
jgi:N-acetylmuramoyl-L-alanine amidase